MAEVLPDPRRTNVLQACFPPAAPPEPDTASAADVLPNPPRKQDTQARSQPNPRNYTPYLLGFSFASCIRTALKLGKNRPIMLDSTHGTNNMKYPLYSYTLLVVDEHGHGHPVAWFFSSSEEADCLILFLQAFENEVSAGTCSQPSQPLVPTTTPHAILIARYKTAYT
jgi:hypothetical protein